MVVAVWVSHLYIAIEQHPSLRDLDLVLDGFSGGVVVPALEARLRQKLENVVFRVSYCPAEIFSLSSTR